MKSLRSALLVFILGGLLIVLGLSGAAVFSAARSEFRAQFDDDLLKRARAFAAFAIQERGSLEFDYHGSLREEDLGYVVRMRSDRGAVMAQSPDWSNSPWQSDEIDDATDTAEFASVRDEAGSIRRALRIRLPATMDPDSVRDSEVTSYQPRHIIIEVISRTDSLVRAERSVLGALVFGAILAMIGALLAVWLGIRTGLRPVKRLCAELDRIDSTSPQRTTSVADAPVELRPIVTAVDRLLNRLRGAIERERRFVDAAAHELRTPIAELRTLTDVAGRWPDPERLTRSVKEARHVADEMDELLEVLLTAARRDEATEPTAKQPIELRKIVGAELSRFEQELRARGIHAEIGGDEHAGWAASEGACRTMVRNLIENAAEYTPSGGLIRARIETTESGAVLEIENGPVSLTAAQAELIFEPFWRADESRSDRRHRGLGLAVVASICEVVGLSRKVELSEERILTIRLAARQSDGS